MKFIRIAIKDFLSIGEADVQLQDRGMVLVTGRNLDNTSASSNGSGKSAIFVDAIAWVCWGKTVRGVAADEVIRRKTDCCAGILDIEDDQGNKWGILRARGSKSELTLQSAGEDVSGATASETQIKINRLLGFDYDSFVSSVMVGQGSMRFAQSSDKNQKQILERLLGITIYDSAQKVARERLSRSKLSRQFFSIDYNKAQERLEGNTKRLKTVAEQAEKDEVILAKKSRYCYRRIRRLNRIINKLKPRMEQTESLIDDLPEYIRKVDKYGSKIRVLWQRNTSVSKRMKDAMVLIEDLENESSKCQACGQDLPLKSRRKMKYEAEADCKKAEQEIKEISLEYNRAKEWQDKYKTKVDGFKKLTKSHSRIVGKIRFYEGDLCSQEAMADMLKNTKGGTEKQLEEIRLQIKNDKRLVEESKLLAKKSEREISRLEFWEKGFGPSGVRSYLLDEVVPYLNERANHYAEIMLGGDVSIEFSTITHLQKGGIVDKFQVEVKNRHGANVYLGNSEGEKQRVDVCVALALHDLARSRSRCKVNIMVFDEVFERLDEAGSERVVQLLSSQRDKWESCFVISHNDALEQYFSSRIEVVKKNGISGVRCESF